jgi:hypothetical protein
VILYMAAFSALLWEPYYYLALLPVAAIFTSRVFSMDWDRIIQNSYFSCRWGKTAAICVVALLVARYAVYAYVVPAGYASIYPSAKLVDRLADPTDLIVVGHHPGACAMLYYSNRKGWDLAAFDTVSGEKIDILKELEKLRIKGARYFLVVEGGSFSYEYLSAHIGAKYQIVEHKPEKYTVYKLD